VKKSGYVYVEGDVNGNGKADFQIKVLGVSGLDKGDFFCRSARGAIPERRTEWPPSHCCKRCI
jgi:hypothetical protein